MNKKATTNDDNNDDILANDHEDASVDTLENNNRASTEAGAVRGVARSVQNAVGQRLVKFPAMGRLPAPPPSPSPSSLSSTLSSISKSTTTASARMRLPKNLPKARAGGSAGGSAGARVTGSAGARATARSAGRNMPSSVPPKSIPVRQVAKISDRMSTGLDVFDTAQETGVSWRLSRVVSFAIAMIKNTLLGAAVFETYCYTVENFAPPAIDSNSNSSIGSSSSMHDDNSDDHDDDTNKHNAKSSLDAYARASPLLHTAAGFLGGGVHGIMGTLWETAALRFGTTSTTATSLLSPSSPLVSMPRMTLHHGMAHGALFGSYELWKRILLQSYGAAGFDATTTTSLHDAGHTHAYLGCVIVAGGLAGQVQHVMSHYTEQWLRLEEGPGAAMMEEAASSSSSSTKSMTTNVMKFRPPVLRSVLMAFPASAVGFVAFEYGRSIGSAN